MTGRDVYFIVSGMLGYDPTPTLNGANEIMAKNTVTAIYRVLDGLTDKQTHIKKLNDEITEDKGLKDALIYGVAMFLALIDGDAVKQSAYCAIYNAKRKRYKSTVTSVKDVMPR